jgi:hypothetical protein
MYEYSIYLEAERNGVPWVVCEKILAEFPIILNSIAEVETAAKLI